ncbi:MAG: hypothetical protein U0793_25505 [Gemmataceae bacterium]
MKIVIKLTTKEELKALPLLLRHSPGMVLPGRTYVLSEEAVKELRKARIRFQEISREGAPTGAQEVVEGERI